MENVQDMAEKVLTELLKSTGVPHKGIVREDVAGQHILSIQADDPRQLIGMHGDTVHALDHLVKKIVEHRVRDTEKKSEEDEQHFLVDVHDYRSRQIKDLQTKALMMAERARSFQYDVEMPPMSAYERLIVHTTLQGSANVKTESQGEGRSRRVVIKYSA